MDISFNPILLAAAVIIASGILVLLIGLVIHECCSRGSTQLEHKELFQELGGEQWVLDRRLSIDATPVASPPPYSARQYGMPLEVANVADNTTNHDPLSAIDLDNAAQIAASNQQVGSPTYWTVPTACYIARPPTAMVGHYSLDFMAMERDWKHRMIV